MFADPCRVTAVALLKLHPSAQAIAAVGVEALAAKLHELAPRIYGRQTAQQLVQLAQQSSGSRLATPARSTTLQILCDQREHTQANLTQLEQELDKLLETDDAIKGLKSTPEFGRKTVAVPRAELGDVARFQRVDQVVAYAGLDIQVKESGKWKGQAKLSKRGSGRLRRILYPAAVRSIRLPGSAFGAYYHRLIARGLKAGEAIICAYSGDLCSDAGRGDGATIAPTCVGKSSQRWKLAIQTEAADLCILETAACSGGVVQLCGHLE